MDDRNTGGDAIFGPTKTPIDLEGGYDTDAQDYFDAVEAEGGSFDLTSISGTYTESYVKQAHSALFETLKSDGVWDKIDEYILLIGKNWGGSTVKLKGTGAAILFGFVIGDWTAAGSGGGLQGGGTKEVRTGFTPLDSEDISFGGYIAALNSTSGRYYMGHGSAPNGQAIGSESVAGQWRFYDGGGDNVAGHQVGSVAFTRRAANDAEYYSRGISVFSDSGAGTSAEGFFRLFAFGSGSLQSNGKLTTGWIGRGMTSDEIATISAAEQIFMQKLGAEAY